MLRSLVGSEMCIRDSTSTSCVYLRNHMLTTATTGHHLASVLFNTAPLLPHLVQCSASARQHLRPVAPAINPEDVTVSRFRTYMPPPRGTIPSVDNDLLSLTTVLFGDDLRYKRTLTAAKRASHQQQCERDAKLFALLLESACKHNTYADSGNHQTSSAQSSSSEMATKELLARHSNIAIDTRSLRTPSSIIPAGCASQLFVPLATLAKSQQPALSEEDVLLLTVRQKGTADNYSQQHSHNNNNNTLTPTGDPSAHHNFARFPSLHAANSMSSIGLSLIHI
eukprot:TRINITY_DN28975_c0_g1_i1.p1 TRINITY_DN28975_c0_g1~~TRINITY_DN28975_c0_g1_i1.p1  ORF type:complete len:281 (+),score=38.36 TRINITY_DN28975_c0_g1_i1:152-994(+)